MPSCNSDSWGRYTLKCLCWCVEGKAGELVQPGGASEDCLEVCFVGLVVGRNYVWCLVIVVIFMGFGGAKGWGRFKSIIWGDNASHKKGKFLWERGVLIM